MKGHGEAPSVAETEQFCRIVRGFLQVNDRILHFFNFEQIFKLHGDPS